MLLDEPTEHLDAEDSARILRGLPPDLSCAVLDLASTDYAALS